jgi:hypothetical protein
MPKVIACFWIILTGFTANAQQPGNYIINNDINKFIGTWQWTQGADTLKVTFVKVKVFYSPPANFHADRILGWHTYIKNGTQIESSFQLISSTPTVATTTVLGGTIDDANELSFNIQDLSKGKLEHVNFKLQPGSLTVAEWKLKNNEGVRYGDYDFGFTFPVNLIFHKL